MRIGRLPFVLFHFSKSRRQGLRSSALTLWAQSLEAGTHLPLFQSLRSGRIVASAGGSVSDELHWANVMKKPELAQAVVPFGVDKSWPSIWGEFPSASSIQPSRTSDLDQ